MNLLADLNPEQIEAVTHVDGPLLVLAGAGSGKTRVITRRIAHLIAQGISPNNILAITFTNKAAREMQERVVRLIPGGQVWISTFHKFCARLLRIHGDRVGLRSGYVIYDTIDRLKVIRDCVAKAGLDRTQLPPERIEHEISRAKNELCDAIAYSERASDFTQLHVAKIYRAYQETLLQSNAVDFDDLLLHVAVMLRDHPDLRAELDSRHRYVLVDEYQDTNLTQYAILRSLSIDHANLCATGDPDQSIYGWRGANIANILKFESDYPGTRVVRLEKNYRSTKRILAAASQLIRHNSRRKPKELFTDNPEGLPVQVNRAQDERAEAQSMALQIREAVDSGRRGYGDFAVFCRVAALTRNVEMAFSVAQVPYQVLSGVAFYERAEVKDLLAYLKLLVNPHDDVAFERVVNVPPRGIGDTTIDRLRAEAAVSPGAPGLLATARRAGEIATIRPRQADSLLNFIRLIDELNTIKHQCVAEVMRQVIERADFFSDRGERKSSARTAQADTTPSELNPEIDVTDDRRANVEELLSAAHQFDILNPGATVDQFLAESVLATDLDAWDSSRQAVSLMTLHAAKGLEFPVVFIMAIEHGILPHQRAAKDQDGLEEERRLLFVGMTRAREELYLSHVARREFRGTTNTAIPSRFLVELPATIDTAAPVRVPTAPIPAAARGRVVTGAELAGTATPMAPALGLREGMLVNHPTFGLGRIETLTGLGEKQTATIKFTLGGTRKFVVSKTPLKPLKQR